MQSKYDISVVIPNYNYGYFLERCINSVLAQSYPAIEIIVVDDGSTDESIQVIQGYGSKVKLIKQRNCGPSAARNAGIKAASGEWIALLDSDDSWHPLKSETQIKILQSDNSIDFIGTCTTNDFINSTTVDSSFFSVDTAFFLDSSMSPSSAIIHKKCFRQVGMFNEDRRVHGAEDKEMWLRLSTVFKGVMIKSPLTLYNVHQHQHNKNFEKTIKAEKLVLNNYFSTNITQFTKYCRGFSKFYYTAAVSYRDDGKQNAKALLCCIISLIYYPFCTIFELSTLERIKFIAVTFLKLISLK